MITTQPIVSFVKYLQLIIFSAAILYFGKTLFIPLFFGLLIAIIMYPVCKWFEKRRWRKVFEIAACLLIVTFIFGALLIIFIWQLRTFSEDAPGIFDRIRTALQ